MPYRETNVYIKYLNNCDQLKMVVWCDLEYDTMTDIDGIRLVEDAGDDYAGAYLVSVDPRYNRESIVARIRELSTERTGL